MIFKKNWVILEILMKRQIKIILKFKKQQNKLAKQLEIFNIKNKNFKIEYKKLKIKKIKF